MINPSLDTIKLGEQVELDLETSGLNPITEIVLVISITSLNKTYVLEVNNYTHDELCKFINKLKTRVIVAHNGKFDSRMIYSNFNIFLPYIYDTMIMSKILSNGKKLKHDLNTVLKRYLDIEIKDKKELQKSFIGLTLNDKLSKEQLDYAGKDTKYLSKLKKVIQKELTKHSLLGIEKLEYELLPVLVYIEHHGVKVNRKGWQSIIDNKWIPERDKLYSIMEKELFSITKHLSNKRYKNSLLLNPALKKDEYFNFNSSKQWLDLFRDLKLEVPTDKYNKESVGATILPTWIANNKNTVIIPLLKALLKYRKQAKLLSSFGENFLSNLDSNNYMHTNFNQLGTVTGRLSSSSPESWVYYKKFRELLENLYSLLNYNITGNSKCECLKINKVRQSAAKCTRNSAKVQRLGYGF